MWNFQCFKDNVAFISDNNESCTYNEIIAFSKQQRKYFNKKNLILCLLNNSIDGILGYVGFLQNKQVPLMVNNNIGNDSLKKLIDKYEPDFLWASKRYQSVFSSFDVIHNNKTFCLLQNSKKNTSELHSDLCLLASTSGSTGSQKYVRQSYSNIKSNINSILSYLPISGRDHTITTLPCHYTFGASIIHSHLVVGSKIILTNHPISQKEFWNTYEKNNITTFYGVPYTFEMLDRLKFFSKQRHSLRIIAQAGGKLSEQMQKKIAQYSFNYKKLFFCMYGQAEATTRIAYLEPKKSLQKLGSIGLPIKNGKLYITNDRGEKLTGAYESGNLIYNGPNVCMGYANKRNDLSKSDEWFGTIETGDIAHRDNDGYFYIVGRKKRFAKIFGTSVNLDDLEDILKSKFEKLEVAVVSNDKKVFLVYASKQTKNLSKFLSPKIMLSPSVYIEVKFDKIPKTPSNKISYNEITQELRERDFL